MKKFYEVTVSTHFFGVITLFFRDHDKANYIYRNFEYSDIEVHYVYRSQMKYIQFNDNKFSRIKRALYIDLFSTDVLE